jgi:vacuolar protein sorting-associated protein 13A/C
MLLNFFSNFANISDAEIYFTEIDIINAYST